MLSCDNLLSVGGEGVPKFSITGDASLTKPDEAKDSIWFETNGRLHYLSIWLINSFEVPNCMIGCSSSNPPQNIQKSLPHMS